MAQPICLIGLAQWACYPIRSARKELKARVRKRFLSKDQLRVGWDFSPATLTFKQVTRAPPSPTWGGAASGRDGEPSWSRQRLNIFHFRVTFNRCGFTGGEGRGK